MIKFNEVTWYSRLGAIILFIGVIPVIIFCIGMQYGSLMQFEKDQALMQEMSLIQQAPSQEELPTGMPMGKINIDVVCEGALSYMTFADAASADVFVAECKEGQHPEVIERYKADMNLGDGAAI